MKCTACGCELELGAKLCANCRAEMPESATGEESSASAALAMPKPMPLKKLLLFTVPIMLVILAITAVLFMQNGTRVYNAKNSITFFKNGDTVTVSANDATFTIDGTLHSYQKSMDGSKAIALTDYNDDTSGTLWFVTATNCTLIDDGVFAYQLASSGNGVVYVADYNDLSGIATLYLYDTVAANTTQITDRALHDGYFNTFTGICISPNGKSVSYISDYNSPDKKVAGYIKIDGRPPEKLGDNMLAIAIADGGSYIYYAEMSSDRNNVCMGVRSGENSNTLLIDSDQRTRLILNGDYSQAIFSIGNASYISRNGGEKVKISNSVLGGLFLPRETQAYFYVDTLGYSVYGTRTFANALAKSLDYLVYINDEYETIPVPGSGPYYHRVAVSDDGKTLLFTADGGALTVINPIQPGVQGKVLAEDVATFTATADGKTIYYVNCANQLWCIKGNEKPIKICDNVSPTYLALSYRSNKVFFLVNYNPEKGGELHYTINGEKGIRVYGGDNVTRVWDTPASVFYLTVDADLYRSNGSENFVFLQEKAHYSS